MTTRLIAALGVFAGGLIASPAFAQQQDTQLWLQVNTNIPVADGVRLTVEEIARTSDRQDGLYQTELGGLLGVRAAKRVELGFGYRKVSFYHGNTGLDENRFRQQIVFTSGPISARLRVDERFASFDREAGIRIRPLLRYNYKLTKKGVAAFVSHESFLLPNSTAWGQRAGYERMRNIAGVTLPVGKALSLDVGYLNQYRFGHAMVRPQMDHALSLQLTINLGELKITGEQD